MPSYDYKCETCGHGFEAIRSVDLRDAVLCVFCGDTDVRRIPTAAPVHFKGGGFYATDK